MNSLLLMFLLNKMVFNGSLWDYMLLYGISVMAEGPSAILYFKHMFLLYFIKLKLFSLQIYLQNIILK